MRCNPFIAPALLLAACNPPEDTATNETSAEVDGGMAEQEATAKSGATLDGAASEETDPSPEELALVNTAWRVTGEEGAIYTTSFDPEGRYRDMKNGDLWADGSWERLDDGRLCFSPSDKTRAGACWKLGKHKKNGTMRATSEAGREVLLQQVTYLAPEGAEEG